MPNFQELLVVGHVGRDCELKYTPQGVAVASFSIAVSKKFGQGDSAREITTWFNCTLWQEQAENLSEFIRKGHALMVWGEVTTRAYIDKNSNAAASLEIRVHRVQFIEKREQQESTPSESETADVPF